MVGLRGPRANGQGCAERSGFHDAKADSRLRRFGDAFFNRALRTAPSLEAAFDQARRLVTAREKREGFEPSNPQIAGGSELLALLARPKAAKADTGPAGFAAHGAFTASTPLFMPQRQRRGSF